MIEPKPGQLWLSNNSRRLVLIVNCNGIYFVRPENICVRTAEVIVHAVHRDQDELVSDFPSTWPETLYEDLMSWKDLFNEGTLLSSAVED